MKCYTLCLLLLALLSLLQLSSCERIRVRTETKSYKRVWVRNGDIRVNGNCNNCDIRTSKNTAQVTSRQHKVRTTYH
ncbi:maker112 [Drosophila busckii]|uniref:Maker112 n=1 Tax=Drosophila busckii TaxID=30019 RepID=A0A0M3QVH6_DROBS|nr:maker112 [Drosophila busckii]